MRQGGAALLARLRRVPAALGERVSGPGRAQLLWVTGAVVLIAGGLGLAFFGGSSAPPPANERIDVPLPPAASAKVTLLAQAPDAGLIEDGPNGPLPVIGKDGREAWQVYARPFDNKDTRPRIALIVTGIGLDRSLSQAALDRLPGLVTLGFDPYADDIGNTLANARSLGHEALLGLPMEPIDYPRQDPGPLTLLTSLDETQNTARLSKLLGEASGYVGMVALMGSRFEAETSSVLPMLEALKHRGLMLVDDKAPAQSSVAPLAVQMKLPWAAGDRVIDAESDPAALDQALADLETTAKRNGAALGVAALSPALLDHLGPWLAALDGKGFALAPASAIANRQSPAQPAQ
ncbi:MAG TPA: divergent polysaccharide deacetylase family protein [Stellaceae bacterium]|jgi:polysaccharide deacetylase 2 family uncharacterized protein YibQ|nr:divergent polysaccharide deacetylase family protein [Stellaceae bacterium]